MTQGRHTIKPLNKIGAVRGAMFSGQRDREYVTSHAISVVAFLIFWAADRLLVIGVPFQNQAPESLNKCKSPRFFSSS
jgi:hypothetical protein